MYLYVRLDALSVSLHDSLHSLCYLRCHPAVGSLKVIPLDIAFILVPPDYELETARSPPGRLAIGDLGDVVGSCSHLPARELRVGRHNMYVVVIER